MNTPNNSRRLWRLWPLVIAVVACGFVRWHARVACAAAVVQRFVSPLPSRVAKLVLIKGGSHSYLRDYGAVIKALSAPGVHWTLGGHLNWKAFHAVEPEFRRLVRAVNQSPRLDALYNRILESVTVTRRDLPSHGRRWRYGKIRERMFLSTILTRRSRNLLKLGRKREAAEWGRASLFLWSQDDVTMGTSGVLAYWCSGRGTASANLAALRLPPGNVSRLVGLFRSALKRDSREFSDTGFDKLGSRLEAPHPPHPVLSKYLDSVHHLVVLGLSGRPHYALVGLGSLYSIQAGLAARGHRGLCDRISVWAAAMERRVISDRALPRLYRAALLRWIKEAVGP